VETELQQAMISAAFVAELLEGAASNACRDAAARALTDFICLLGLSHFVAEGVVQTVSGNGEPSESVVAEDKWGSAPKLDEEEQPTSVKAGADRRGTRHAKGEDDAARARRVQAQEQRKANLRWDYTGGYRAELPKETNEEAMLRMISSRAKLDEDEAKPSSVAGDRKFKRQICMFWEQGKCEKGRYCTFAHGVDDIASSDRGWAPATQEAPEQTDVRNYKRDICIYFKQGRCDKGERCTFAHGKSELDMPDAKYAVHYGPSWESGPRYKA